MSDTDQYSWLQLFLVCCSVAPVTTWILIRAKRKFEADLARPNSRLQHIMIGLGLHQQEQPINAQMNPMLRFFIGQGFCSEIEQAATHLRQTLANLAQGSSLLTTQGVFISIQLALMILFFLPQLIRFFGSPFGIYLIALSMIWLA